MEQLDNSSVYHARKINQTNWTIEKSAQIINQYIENIYTLVPKSIQSEIFFFIHKYINIDDQSKFDFLQHFKKPTWTVVHHLCNKHISNNTDKDLIFTHALYAQGLSLFLHTLDDHLCDGDLPIDHVMLIFRNAVWNDFIRNVEILEDLLNVKSSIRIQNIDRYSYGASIHENTQSFGEYIYAFQLTMKLGTIVSHIIMTYAKCSSSEIHDILDSLYSYGCAWRILDDIDDLSQDILNNKFTAPYFLLNMEEREKWFPANSISFTKEIVRSPILNELFSYINVFTNFSVNIAQSYNLESLADEYSCIIKD